MSWTKTGLTKAIVMVVGLAFITQVTLGQGIGSIVENRKASGELRVYHWWTAGGEKNGIDAAFSYFSKQYPKIKINDAPIAGGAGTNLKQVVKIQVVAGNAPEAFQAHAGYEIYPYYESDLLQSCDDVWEYAGLEERTPEVISDISRINGHYYCVPIGIHRTNVIWYNKTMFQEYGIEEPTDSMTLQDLWNLCDTLRDTLPLDVYPLGLGDRENWPATHIFETLMIAVNPKTYENFINGVLKTEELTPVFKAFEKYLSYVPPDHRARTWDEACGMIVQGKVAMYLHGDWAKGYFSANGWDYGEEYSSFVVPGTGDRFGASTDSFVRPKNSANPENGVRWQSAYTTIDAQKVFNLPKGSVSPYSDVPTETYDKYSRKSAETLYDPLTHIYPSIAHGSGSPEIVVSQLNVAIGNFAQNPQNIQRAVADVINAVKSTNHPIVWNIA